MSISFRCEGCGGPLRAAPRDATDEDVALLARFCSIHCYHFAALSRAQATHEAHDAAPY